MTGSRDYDPRLVDMYDADNPDGPDHAYYRDLARRTAARSVLDLGCGTGILTVTLAEAGRAVVGVDPSPAMLAYARRRPGADAVTWIEGDSRAAPDGPFDLVLMAGNVAQHIPDPEWQRTVRDLRRVMADGAVLAFESRNPAARAWEAWAQDEPTTRDTPHGPLREWCEVAEPGDGRVLLRFFNHFERSDEVVVEDLVLTFRYRDSLTRELTGSGFEVTAVHGDWCGTPFTGDEPLMVIEATAAGQRGARRQS